MQQKGVAAEMTAFGHRGKNLWEKYDEVSIEELDLQDDLIRTLVKHGILTVGQILVLTTEDLKKVRKGSSHYLHDRSIEKIQRALEAMGLPRLPKYVPLTKIKQI